MYKAPITPLLCLTVTIEFYKMPENILFLFYAFRMKNSNISSDRQGMEGYVNHGLNGSTINVDIVHSYNTDVFQSFHDSHENHRGIQGSSDFICEFRTVWPSKR